MEYLFLFIAIAIFFILLKDKVKGGKTKIVVRRKESSKPNSGMLPIEVGDAVALWVKPNSKEVFVYDKKTVTGDRLLGVFKSAKIAKAYPSELYRVTTNIINIRGNNIYLSDDFRVIRKGEVKAKSTEKFLTQSRKKIRKIPQITLKFNMPDSFQWNRKVFLQIGDVEAGENDVIKQSDWKCMLDQFWLCDSDGNKISIDNYTKREDTIALLRVIRSGYHVDLEYKKGRDTYLDLEKEGLYSWVCNLSKP